MEKKNYHRLTRYLPVLETDETLYEEEAGCSEVIFRFAEDLYDTFDEEQNNETLRKIKDIFDREENSPGNVFRNLDIIVRLVRKLENTEEIMNTSALHRVSYSPGYGDMRGEYHEKVLRRSKDDNWIMVCRDREYHERPTIETVYEVSPEAAAGFEAFISEKKVLSLAKRPESGMFMTDYSPFCFDFEYEEISNGKTKTVYTSVTEYKKYSKRDYELLDELRERFLALKGQKLSETLKQNS